MSEDPMYGLRGQIRDMRSPAHDHDPRTCPECKDRAEQKAQREQAAPPRDRQVKAPRRNR